MPYRPSYGLDALGAAPRLGAIVPASGISATFGTIATFAYLLAVEPPFAELSAGVLEVILFLTAMGAMLALATVAAGFVTAFYLFVIGLPAALLLRERIRSPSSLFIICPLIILAAGFVHHRTFGGLLYAGDSFSTLPSMALVLVFAIPAGLLYRHYIIAMLDEAAPD